MSVPDFQTLMLPLLALHHDNEEHALRETIESLADKLQLSTEDRRELLPSGKQPRFDNRVGWARTYLKKAGLLESPARNRYRITEQGRQVLAQPPERIDIRFLSQFDEFNEFREVSAEPQQVSAAPSTLAVAAETGGTPFELLEAGYNEIMNELTQDLLVRIKACSWQFFEQLVIDLLLAMGYGGSREDAGRAFQSGGDEGIDGVIKEDRLGLRAIYVQAKRWQDTVHRPTVQAFTGSLMGMGADRGVLITTSRFSEGAKQYARAITNPKVILMDGPELAQLMIEHNVGVTEVSSYVLKRPDLDYFEEA